MLLQLTAGTLFTQTTFGATGFSGTRAWDVNGSLSIHGSRTGNNEFLIEGAPSAGTGGGTGNWNYAPPVDAIEEFKVSTSSVDASFGRTSGGVVNMTFRSGTNQLRGSGILLHRGTWLDANQIQNIRNNISNKEHKYFNGEAMVSGPIRRGKTFFMGGYQGFYENIPFPVTRTVPTAAQLRGDFSQTTTANGTPILIYDPATTTCNANLSSCTRQPFPGNIIPENRWSPIAKALLPYIPQAERDAEQPVRVEQLHQLAEPRPLSLQLVPDAHRSRLQRHHRLSFSNSGELGHRVPQRERAAGAGDPQRQLPDAPQPLPDHRRRQPDDRLDDAVEHALLVGPVRRAARQAVRRRRSEPAVHGPVPAHRAAVPADQHRRLSRACSRGRSGSRRTTPTRPAARSRRRWAGTSRRSAASSAPTSSSAQDEVNSNGVVRLQQPVHAPRPAEQHRRRVGQRLGDVPARPADERQRRRPARRAPSSTATTPSIVQDDWKLSSRATLNVGLRWDYQPPVTVQGRPHGIGVRRQRDQSAAVAAAAGRRDHQPGDRSAAHPQRRAAVRQPRRSGVAVQDRLEQHPAARRRHLQGQRLAGIARPTTAGRTSGSRAAARTASTRPTSSGRRRSSPRRRTASIREHRGRTRSLTASSSRSPASWGC